MNQGEWLTRDSLALERAEEESASIIEEACKGTRWRLEDCPTLDGDGDECQAGITLSIVDIHTLADGAEIARELADALIRLAANLRKGVSG